KDQALEYWREPKTTADIIQIFKSYILCKIPVFPWSEEPLSEETEAIRPNLIRLNELGYLTVSSQPAVNGVRSDDVNFGWGPKGGYIYQKFFVEFFVSSEMFDKLIKVIDDNGWVTYYAAKRNDEFKKNMNEETSTAVTWGVFPGKEIVQPTIIEEVSFKAWKEVAFELWSEWEHLYPKDSITQKLLKDIGDNWWLVNLVYNDYVNPEGVWNIFFENE
ncbi:13625_t:CDS:2, partial [Cetraspora pellucida]